MDLQNVNKDKNISPDEDLAWDEIDIDEVARNIHVEKENQRKMLEKQQVVMVVKNTEEDGNYFDSQPAVEESKKQQKQKIQPESSVNNQNNCYVQPFSQKDLLRIKNFTKSSSTFHNLLYETYGHFDKLISTHDEQAMPHENLVELLNIDIALLSIPFDNHNIFLLKSICNIPSFWSQLLNFLNEFLNTKYKNLTFLLLVDMKTFFINLEIMFHKILVNNLMDSTMEKFFDELVEILENKKSITEWSKPTRFLEIKKEFEDNNNVYKIFDVSFYQS